VFPSLGTFFFAGYFLGRFLTALPGLAAEGAPWGWKRLPGTFFVFNPKPAYPVAFSDPFCSSVPVSSTVSSTKVIDHMGQGIDNVKVNQIECRNKVYYFA